MTNEEKVKLVDHLLQVARDPEIKKALNHSTVKDKRACTLLIKDGDESYWISIGYLDLP